MRTSCITRQLAAVAMATAAVVGCGMPEVEEAEQPASRIAGEDRVAIEAVRLPPLGGTFSSVYHGGTGGAPFSIGCPVNEYAIGVYGRSGSYVDRIGLICAPLKTGSGPQKLGPGHLVATAGGAGGADFALVCPQPWSAMAGLAGRSGNMLDAVSPICRDIADAGVTIPPLQGGRGGGTFVDEHWPGLVIRISGRAGDYIDGIRYVVQPMDFRLTAKETGGGY